ncbi:BON domain-containing protein [Ideonella azotifigens]|uniref:BON domain-containing protein n=1 Tax=Ideonella azotifigens TaxID=513160 RepID=A0ABN1JP73_9BURK|nr:BON domain-containing protein [Ideonella azotifigens]MCD2340041.1 BON domain-containing protein [Ideonella azotifigens]
MPAVFTPRRLASLATLLAATTLAGAGLSACVPLMLGGAAGGVLLYTDRRTSGAQVEDAAIESKAARKVSAVLGDRGHVGVVSYNRWVLLTGEVPNEADRAALEQAVAGIENVRSVTNETAVMGSSSLTSRSNDLIVTSKVKATFVDAGDVQANAFKVVTERGIVYLMGRVTTEESDRAANLARAINGVQKVVKVTETITEEERKALQAR